MVVGIPGMNIPTNPRPTHDQPTIKRINFVGAEPFLVDEFYIILEKLINWLFFAKSWSDLNKLSLFEKKFLLFVKSKLNFFYE